MSERVSANEFCVSVAKACVAGSVERSAARDMAMACCVLENAGVASLPLLLDALEQHDCAAAGAVWSVDGNQATATAFCTLRDGTAACDLAASFDVAFDCSTPFLMRGLARLRGLHLDEADAPSLRLSNGGEPVAPRGPIVFRDMAWWRRIEELSKGILVPATDATRADAGAGTTDND